MLSVSSFVSIVLLSVSTSRSLASFGKNSFSGFFIPFVLSLQEKVVRRLNTLMTQETAIAEAMRLFRSLSMKQKRGLKST